MNRRLDIRTLCAGLSCILAASCSGPPEDEDEAPIPTGQFELVWSDEFTGAAGTPLDGSKWGFDVGGDGWGNEQLEFNTDRVENASLDGDGNLAITARKESYQGNAYTSARIQTAGKFEQAYGRFEARIKLPRGQGIWPAFWMLGGNFGEVGWPTCGEIDIMEFRGQVPRVVIGSLHGPGYSGGDPISDEVELDEDLPDDFHVFAVEWDPSQIVWSVDGRVFHAARPSSVPAGGQWVYDHPFFLILNVAVGGRFVGSPDATTQFPAQMLVDYVRVYRRTP